MDITKRVVNKAHDPVVACNRFSDFLTPEESAAVLSLIDREISSLSAYVKSKNSAAYDGYYAKETEAATARLTVLSSVLEKSMPAWIRIVIDKSVWHIEHDQRLPISHDLYHAIRREMARQYPELRYLYDLEPQDALTDIFGAVKSAGVEWAHWCSDLYFPVTPETSQIVSRYAYKQNVSKFKDNITGKPWYEIPFAYSPYFIDHQPTK